MLGRVTLSALSICSFAAILAASPSAIAADIVIATSNVTTVQGNWFAASDGSAAGGQKMMSNDYGWSATATALPTPSDYFEATFSANAGTNYHVWVRMHAGSNSKWNDSIWLQFSDSIQNGSAAYRLGGFSALLVNLATDPSGSSLSGWGWEDGAYWLSQSATVQFANSGSHTLRVQTREDGVQVDQIVLSSSTYLSSAPGGATNDSTIVSGTSTSSSSSSSSGTTTSSSGSGGLSPFSGSPASIPGTIEAENFDNGGEGVAYHDATAGNSGGQYRSTNVDIESSSNGGYDVGWISPGEWLNYTVNVAASGTYSVALRVASPGGSSMHVGFNGGSGAWNAVSIPATGDWQAWTTVTTQVSLSAGTQQMTIYFDNSGINLDAISVSSGSGGTTTTTTTTSGGSGSSGGSTISSGTTTSTSSGSGTSLSVADWNVEITDSESHARLAMDMLMSISPRPQVVVIEEAWYGNFGAYIDELQNQTGKTWHGAWATLCAPGDWNGSSCSTWYEGVGIFTTYDILATDYIELPFADCWTSARPVLRAAINVNGTTVQVFGTHLQTGGCTDDATSRYRSMSMLKSWASNFSTPQIVAGDFNADPDQIDTSSGMSPNFVDSWSAVGSGNGYTAFSEAPTMKLDYWFSDPGGRAAPQSSEVITWTGSISDHFPVHTMFLIK